MSRRKVDGRFLYPTEIDPPRKCLQIEIPDNPEHEAAFWGALNELAMPFAWEWVSEGSGSAVSAVWKEILSNAAESYAFDDGGCMGCDDCYNDIDLTIQIYNTRITTINTWYSSFVASGSVSINATLVTNVAKMGQGHDVETTALYCYMATLWVEATCNGLLAALDNPLSDVFGWIADIAGAAERVLGAFTTLPIPTYFELGFLAGELAAGLAQRLAQYVGQVVPPAVKTALEDPEARREIACCITTYLAGSPLVRTWAQWETAMLSTAACGTLSPNGEVLRVYLIPIVRFDVWYTMFYKSLDFASWLDAALSLPSCSCPWCYNFDFVASDGGWTVSILDRPFGTYVAAQGWTSTFPAYPVFPATPTQNDAVYIVEFPPTAAMTTEIIVDYNATGTTAFSNLAIALYAGGVLLKDLNQKLVGAAAIGTHQAIWSDVDGTLADEIRVIYTSDNVLDTIIAVITNVKLTGFGDNPWGADNC